MIRPGVIERAYQLARSGDFRTVTEVKRRIRAEGYINVEGHLQGTAIRDVLRGLCASARMEKVQ